MRAVLCAAWLLLCCHSVENKRSPRHQRCPRIEVVSSALYEDLGGKKITYGAAVDVSCSGPNASLVLTKNGERVNVDYLDGKIVYADKPDIGKFTYSCNNTKTACESSFKITVTPTLAVISPSFKYFDDEWTTLSYGDSISVLCSGMDAARLKLAKNGVTLPTVNVNQSTVKWFDSNPDILKSNFVCTDLVANVSKNFWILQKPKMIVQHQNETKTGFTAFYGDTVEVICTGPRGPAVTMFQETDLEHSEILPEILNDTSVKGRTETMELGRFLLLCISNDIPYLQSNWVYVDVKPRIDISPYMRRLNNVYEIKYGDPLQITCSGPDAAQITIINSTGPYRPHPDSRHILEGHLVNKTTIKSMVNKSDDILYSTYFGCISGRHSTYIEVKFNPMALQFHCVSHSNRHVKCSWNALSEDANFTLFHNENGNHATICTLPAIRSYYGSELTKSCTWDYLNDAKEFSFLMQSCNYFGCANETFSFERLAIEKLPTIDSVRVNHTSPYSAVLQWLTTHVNFTGEDLWHGNDIQYKVEAKYLDGDWNRSEAETNDLSEDLETNSLVSCSYQHCRLELELPCPGLNYKVWLYQKLSKAIGEDFWSDPSTVTFQADVGNEKGVLDSKCTYNLTAKIERKRFKERLAILRMYHETHRVWPTPLPLP